MYKKTRSTKVQKQNISSVGKRGFTLVELSVVMALLAILATMTVTFTVTMRDSVDASQSEYAFLEDYSKIKDEISKKLKEYDVANNQFKLDDHDTDITIYPSGDPLGFSKLTTEYEITFDPIDGKLIKCTVTSEEDATLTMSFVCAIRFATIERGGS